MYFAGVSLCIVTQANLKLFILLRLRIKRVYIHTHAFCCYVVVSHSISRKMADGIPS